MGSRYLVTGADLYLIKSLIKYNSKECVEYVDSLLSTRYTITTDNEIENDIFHIKKILKEKV